MDLDADTKKGIFIVLILALGAISLLGLFDIAGLLGLYFKNALIYTFGWGRWFLPIMLLFWGYALYDEERFELKGGNYLGAILFLISTCAFLFLLVESDSWYSSVAVGKGGGHVGLFFAEIFIKYLGFIASFLVSLGLIIISWMLIFNTTLVGLFGKESYFAKIVYPINFLFAKLLGIKKKEEDAENEEGEEENEEEGEEEEEKDEEENEDENEEENEDEEHNDEEDEDENEDDEEGDNDSEDEMPIQAFNKKPVKEVEELWWMKPTGKEIKIPLSLLDGKRGKPTSGDIEENKNIIRKALENFGIMVEMGAISVGPTVTQYTFKPSEGVKLSRITNLSNDLALALAAHPIRIEAPIPGKRLVGVEVPNQAKAIVSFKEILTSKNYNERKNNLQIALGKDVAGMSWLTDITKMPHLLVAGATNSGKSVCLNTIIVSLMYQNSPDDLRFIMVDPKRVELTGYNGMAYLLAPVITEVPKTINALKWCMNEMDRRFDVLSRSGNRNIQTYNENAKVRMPYIVFVIDELADLMVAASKDIEGSIIRLAQMARAVGIHLVLATQRPSVDVITGLIKANMPARIAFSVASSTDSRTILDSLGAEKLLGRGDMLFMNAELSKPVRLQGAFLSDAEIAKVVKYVKAKGGKSEQISGITERQKVGGVAGVGLDGVSGDEDELLHEAREIVVNMGKASASLLQRKMRVGYARAASILDQLEEAGIVGPANGSKPREILITKRQLESLDDERVSGVPTHNRSESKAPDNYLGEESEVPPAFKDDDEDEGDEDGGDNEENIFKEDEEKVEVRSKKNKDNEEEEDEENVEDEDENEDEEDGDVEEELEDEAEEEIEEEKPKKNNEPFDRLFSK
ncbi:MAG: translocase FtsK/SpoIIIE familiy protein [Candidatus Falkowbacteria bacterium GW2011_GWC2_38_22]|nr:MAG: translocase FtsK/SpoIIIE familiy protein [Candidatus Falkowbacteria bacterium GW2011_GWC2_38_22]